MRVLVLFAHPVETSFGAAVHHTVIDALARAGHEVDDCDLYAEDFQPVLTREERMGYHDLATNTRPVQAYVDRLLRAEAIVLVYPVWNFGFPAMLKGYFDRVFLPGISFKLVDGKVQGNLRHIKKLAAVATYGGARWRAFGVGDPPRKIVKRYLGWYAAKGAKVDYHALYHLNVASEVRRKGFIADVGARMRGW